MNSRLVTLTKRLPHKGDRPPQTPWAMRAVTRIGTGIVWMIR